MSSATFYKWCAKYGGMDASMMNRLKELGEENRRGMAIETVKQGKTTIAQACRAFQLSESGYRYQAKLSSENALIADWLVRLTHNQKDGLHARPA